jgi:hypothetical protein
VPRITVDVVKQEKVGGDLTRIELRVANRGYLGSYGLSSARKLPFSEPLRATVEGDVKLAAPGESVIEIGQLDGWGQGLYSGANVFFPWTRGNVHEKFVTLVVQGKGKVRVKVGCVRVGYRTVEIQL